ncbi:MAG: hypothetical protein ABSD52_01620 [Candidatus Cybelea sp.]|jgi:hypothetical protein
MASFTRFIASVATLAIATMLAGCAGALPSAFSQQQQLQPAGAPIAQRMKCPPDNGVSVRPCAVRLTASKTSATVKTRGPRHSHFAVRDNHCTTKDIVSVAGSGDLWTITAGTGKGHCTVNFIDRDFNGKKLGIATVDVANVRS